MKLVLRHKLINNSKVLTLNGKINPSLAKNNYSTLNQMFTGKETNKSYKTSCNKKLIKIPNKNFSIIHNYHSPRVLYSGIREFVSDENISEYNKYIQAFLNKRFTHKKEITPKISILNTPKGYHNTLYIQKSYPFFTLYDIQNMRFMKSLNILDTGYFITRFFEEYEKPMYDSVLSKLIVSGRVEFMEDKEEFDVLKEKVNKLVKVFYEGDPLSPLEREIERSYLILKLQKQNELMQLYTINQKLKREDIFVSYSEMNKLSGHVNFRMHHPEYNFKACPIFEKIDIENMFYSLFEIRYNSLDKRAYYEKLKLKFQYRRGLIENSDHRIKFLSNFIFTQIIQNIDSWEFNNFFDLNLNFKVNLNLAILHCWFIINRLKNICFDKQTPDKIKKYCNFLIEDLIERLINYSNNNQFKFEFYNDNKDLDKISNSKYFIKKLLDQYTFHFDIFESTKNNKLMHLPLLLNGMIFNGSYDLNDKNLKKFTLYAYEYYWYFNNKSYKDIERCDFNFSVYEVPINYTDYISTNDNFDFYNYNSYSILMKDYLDKKDDEKFKKTGFTDEKILVENYQNNKNKLLTYRKNKNENSAQWIINAYGNIPYEDKKLFMKYDYTKTWMYRIHMFLKNENDVEKGLLIEKKKYEEEQIKKLKKDPKYFKSNSMLDSKNKEKENLLGLSMMENMRMKK